MRETHCCHLQDPMILFTENCYRRSRSGEMTRGGHHNHRNGLMNLILNGIDAFPYIHHVIQLGRDVQLDLDWMISLLLQKMPMDLFHPLKETQDRGLNHLPKNGQHLPGIPR